LYEWFIQELGLYAPQQIEFARLQLNYTVLSKRKLIQLVKEGHVNGWDDPRMPTLSGVRRRGYTAQALRAFCDMIGVARANSIVDIGMLEYAVREDLNQSTARVMAVLDPLKVVIENYPEGQEEWFESENNPLDLSMGSRQIPFSREIYIEREDFMENPPSKFHRLGPGREVRLMKAYYITCTEVVKDAAGHITELRCTYDPQSRGGNTPDGRKVKGTIHWVSVPHALDVEVRLYDRLFLKEDPNDTAEGQTFLDNLNPHSLEILPKVKVEPSLKSASIGEKFQFMRNGYFVVDMDTQPGWMVFNRTVGLKDSWAKMSQKE
jgi:glutaminyl-tRNA synthetase